MSEFTEERLASWYASAAPSAARRASRLRVIADGLADVAVRSRVAGQPAAARERGNRDRHIALVAALFLVTVASTFGIMRRTSVTPAPAGARAAAAGVPLQREISFEVRIAGTSARRVTLAGDFNGWNANAIALRHDSARGVWRVRVSLPPGRHAYSYVVDGNEWVIDPLAPRADEGALGATNIIAVPGE